MSKFSPQDRADTGARTAAALQGPVPAEPRTPVEAAWRDFVYAEVWTRPGLDRRSRFIIAICGAAVAPGPDRILDAYVRGALATGELNVSELREIALHLSGYAGFSQAARLDDAITRIVADLGEEEPDLEPLRGESWTTETRQAENDESFRKVMTTAGPGHISAFYEAGVMNYCFGELWARPGLDQRSRRLVTLVAAADSQAPSAVLSHTYSAMASGDFTKEEMLEFVEQFAVHGGHTRGSTMQALVLQMADRIEKGGSFTMSVKDGRG
ncbi:carboxymuconolactone decarboxylase family protein [Novosphingobium sp. G106]|uniref:carboxymuconolactone decarboxylase family protein n=1 Tax=Novosphingobium sp. G106 TaxID=2849500 RepID=UPI001C2DEFF1|nr:carboxymuconolactone decarboxylase family protein [Novosphingobium sp. G106]MBV1688233.1 carboxymuconolactone decarboxylase family protein [Novosphingobium sp. G106]